MVLYANFEHIKTEDLFGKVLKHKDETEAKDYLWMLHLACEQAGVDLEIKEHKDPSLMLLIVGGEKTGNVQTFCKGSLNKQDILDVLSGSLGFLARK